MDKLSIRKLFERAKANDTIAQEELYEYYYERYHSFVILDKRIPNIEEIYIESIKNAISRSISNPDSTLDSTQKLVKSTFINKIKSYNRKSVKWGEQKVLPKLIEEASNGSKEARNKLIERYMYIVDKRIENIKFNNHYIEEDIRQAGYLFLTEKINNYFDAGLKVPLSVYLSVAFDQIYLNFLSAASKPPFLTETLVIQLPLLPFSTRKNYITTFLVTQHIFDIFWLFL